MNLNTELPGQMMTLTSIMYPSNTNASASEILIDPTQTGWHHFGTSCYGQCSHGVCVLIDGVRRVHR